MRRSRECDRFGSIESSANHADDIGRRNPRWSSIGVAGDGVGNRTDRFRGWRYHLGMPQYFFHIRQDDYSSNHAEGLEFPDKEAARTEAAAVCGDMMRGIVGQLANRPEWRLDVSGEGGKLLFRFKFAAEAFD
jgi:hypothetical protein